MAFPFAPPVGRLEAGPTPAYTPAPSPHDPEPSVGTISGPCALGLRAEEARNPRVGRRFVRGDDRNRTGVNGFAGRCVATPPRRRRAKRSGRGAGGFSRSAPGR